MKSEKEYTLKEVKLFLENEINPVIKENDLNVDFSAMTVDEYFESDIYKNFCDKGLEDYANQLSKNLALCVDNKIIVFIDNQLSNNALLEHDDKIKSYTKEDVIFLLFTVFHELGHCWQKKLDDKDKLFNFFKLTEEILCRLVNDEFYNNNWHNFYKEAEADLYGITTTIEVLKKYPRLYEGNEDWVKFLNDEIKCRISTYDFNLIFSKFNTLDKSCYKNAITEAIYKDNMKDFNEIEDIVTNFQKLGGEEFTVSILSSDAFLGTLNVDSLNDKEITIMIDVLNMAYEETLTKMKLLENFMNNYQMEKYEKWNYFNNRLHIMNKVLVRLNDLKQKRGLIS